MTEHTLFHEDWKPDIMKVKLGVYLYKISRLPTSEHPPLPLPIPEVTLTQILLQHEYDAGVGYMYSHLYHDNHLPLVNSEYWDT